MDSFTIKIFLYEVEPLIWRRFTVPSTATFADFHHIIQKAMGWNDEQDHQFRWGKGKRLTNVIGNTEEQVSPQDDFQKESEITLGEFVGRRKMPLRMMYRYDFFDDWTHEIVIEERSDSESPEMLDGERACPPEDCGGSFGYKECMEGFAEWMDDDYDPEIFDHQAIKL